MLPVPPANDAPPLVLLVEDSDLVTAALRVLFEETGRRVRVAPTVAAAIAACAEEPPALMLLDLTLPDGDGLGVLAAVRERGTAPRVTVAMTGHDDDATRARCLAAGCADVLAKPVPVRELLRRTDGWLA
ncbi:MAG: PleD family two-component system response regulator [Gemmatimonadaceae bacterium]